MARLTKKKYRTTKLVLIVAAIVTLLIFVATFKSVKTVYVAATDAVNEITEKIADKKEQQPILNVEEYLKRIEDLANNAVPVIETASTTSTSTRQAMIKEIEDSYLYPVDEAPLPLAGAILPFKRVIAYYGNLYSTRMGALGEYSEDVMIGMLKDEARKWEAADPSTPVQIALHYIASTAQGSPGDEGFYTLRMPDSEIDKVIKMAEKAGAIVFLDLQIGLSDLEREIPYLDKYLKMPQVHLGLDPEFAMKGGQAPGKVIGTMDADDINFAAEHLAKIVRDNNLPPKILVVHRFTSKMLTNYQNIQPLPEVQIVIHMDGWGPKAQKINTYDVIVAPEPVQFTGFKIFYKNDLKGDYGGLMTPDDLLELSPRPIYIQYQ